MLLRKPRREGLQCGAAPYFGVRLVDAAVKHAGYPWSTSREPGHHPQTQENLIFHGKQDVIR